MSVTFFKVNGPEAAAGVIAKTLNRHLGAGERVLWLVPGGSAAKVAAITSQLLTNKENLAVTLSDERYGEPGHIESNWKLLLDHGFQFGEAKQYPVLQSQSFSDTEAAYENFFKNWRFNYDYTAALLGMGADGHTSGILPFSPAAVSKNNVAGFVANDYNRLTTTSTLLSAMDELFIYALGPEKHRQIEKLDSDIDVREQPIQLIKSAKSVSFFNDLKGDGI